MSNQVPFIYMSLNTFQTLSKYFKILHKPIKKNGLLSLGGLGTPFFNVFWAPAVPPNQGGFILTDTLKNGSI